MNTWDFSLIFCASVCDHRLTAFVVKCLQQAQSYIQVDLSVLNRARDWLLSHQGAQGEFPEMGTVMHTEMHTGVDSGPIALTAYVLIALLEDKTNAVSS